MTNYAGYMGKVIRLDLGSRSVSEYPWTDRDRQLYLGGKAMASKIMYDNFTGSEKPLEPENIIVISTGPLTGTGAPSSSRFNISTLSPQTHNHLVKLRRKLRALSQKSRLRCAYHRRKMRKAHMGRDT